MSEPESSAVDAGVVQLSAKASGFARRGRPWFFRDDVLAGETMPARLVRVRDEDGRDLGLGAVSYTHLTLPTSDLV